MIGLDVQQAYIKSSHANLPARGLNLCCTRSMSKIISRWLSINPSCWSNNSGFFRLLNWGLVISQSKKLPSSSEVPLLEANNLVTYVITWSNFQDKTFIYLHRCCSKDKGIARHFPSRQRIQCRRAESQVCGPISHVLLPQLWVRLKAQNLPYFPWLLIRQVLLDCHSRPGTIRRLLSPSLTVLSLDLQLSSPLQSVVRFGVLILRMTEFKSLEFRNCIVI